MVLSRSVQLSWDLPFPEHQNGKIILYTITVTYVETGATYSLTTTNTMLTVSSLTPFKTYQFSVAASTAVGQGPYTPQLSVTTLMDGMP